MKKFIKNWLITPSVVVIIISLVFGIGFYFIKNTNAEALTWSNVFANNNEYAVMSSIEFDDKLFIGTSDNSGTGGRIWSTSNGTDWSQASADGIGVAANVIVTSFAEFNGNLYASTQNAGGGFIYRCLASSGCDDHGDWNAVCNQGISDVNNTSIASLYAYDDNLYAGTYNANGLETWRCGISTECDEQGDWNKIDGGNGFGDVNNTEASSLTTYNGNLYVGTLNGINSQVWYCSNCGGADWTVSNNDGFNDPLGAGMTVAVESLEVFGNSIYAGTERMGGNNGRFVGSSDGAAWSQIGADGFGSIARTFYTLLSYRNNLYTGTYGGATGIWSSPTPSTGASWEQKNSAGFGDGINGTFTLSSFNNYLYAGAGNLAMGQTGSVYRADLRSVVSNISASQSTDGDGKVAISLQVNDPDQSDVRVRAEYSTDGGVNWSKATLSTDDNDTSATFGDPKVGNSSNYQLGNATGYIITSSGANTVSTVWTSKSDVPDADTDNAMIRITPNDLVSDGDSANSAAFSLDNVAPVISNFNINPDKAKKGDKLNIKFNVDESPLSRRPTVTVDGRSATFLTWSGVKYSYRYSVTGKENEGRDDVIATATDPAGNVGTKTEKVTLNFTAPTTTATPGSGSYNSTQHVRLSSNENATIYYTTDGSNPTADSNQYANKIIVSQNATIKFFAVDDVGNQENVKSATYTFDYTAPVTTANPPGGVYQNTQAVTLSSNEAATIYYTVDSTEPTTRSGIYNGPLLIQENTTLKFFGVDRAGNQENTHTEQYIITSTSPYVTLSKSYSTTSASGSSSSSTGSNSLLEQADDLIAKSKAKTIIFALILFWILTFIILAVIAFFKNKRSLKKTYQYIFKKQKTITFTILIIILLASCFELAFLGTNLKAATIYQGDILAYRINYANKGAVATSDLRVVDPISSSTSFMSSSINMNGVGRTDAGDNDGADYNVTNPGTVTFDIGQINPGQSGFLEFQAQVDYNAQAGTNINNTAIGSYNPGAIFVQSNTISNTVYGPSGGPIEEEEEIVEEEIEEIIEEEEIIERVKKISEKVTDIFKNILENQTLRDITKNIIAPLVAALGIINALAAIPFIGTLLPYLGYLLQYITHPTLFFGSRKRWGVVYNSLTKEPVDLAIVRLFSKENDKLIGTRVTDFEGRYLFLVDPGQYYLTITKPYYNFPSKLMGTKSEVDYSGETISVQANDNQAKERGAVSFNVPIDPQEGYISSPANPAKFMKTPIKKIEDMKILPQDKMKQANEEMQKAFSRHKFKKFMSVLGPVLGLLCLLVSPSILTFILFIINIILFLLFRRLAQKKFSSWGKTFDLLTKKNLSKTIVRLFDKEYGRLLLTDISKGDGRYGFLVGKDEYVLTSQKDAYHLPHDQINIKGDKGGVFSKNLGLEKNDL